MAAPPCFVHHPSRVRARNIAAAAVTLLLLGTVTPAEGHVGRTKRVTLVEAGGDEVAVTVEVPTLDAAVALGLGADAEPEAVAAAGMPLAVDVLDGLAVARGGRRCSPTSRAIQADAAALRLRQQLECRGAGALTFADLSLRDADGHETHLTTGVGADRRLRILRTPEPVTVAPAGWVHTVMHFVGEGVLHLVTGYDHLLFVLTLLLGVRRGAAFVRIAAVVTAFTVGHSVTLGWAALGGVQLSSMLVEAVIALSIAVAGVLNIVRPEARAGRPALAFAFGLIHGFGFSSVLAEVGLPSGQQALALMAFNLGIEVGQLAVVALVLIPLSGLVRRPWYGPIVATGGSAAAAACGLVWFAERVHLL